MRKFFILNLLLNLAIIVMAYNGFEGYRVGNMLVTGLSLAFLVVLIYLKVVLSKHIKKVIQQKDQEKKQEPLAKQKKKRD